MLPCVNTIACALAGGNIFAPPFCHYQLDACCGICF